MKINCLKIDKNYILMFFVLGMVFSGCTQVISDNSQPPLPTIVQTTATLTPQPPPPTVVPTTVTQQTAGDVVEPAAQLEEEVVTSSETEENTEAQPEPDVEPDEPEQTEPPPSPADIQLPPLNSINLKLVPVADNFQRAVYATHAKDSTGRLFVVEQRGRILIVKDGAVSAEPFLDITALIEIGSSEQGLLSVAFHPNYVANGYFFVNYTNSKGDTVIARYQVSENPDIADPDSAKILLTIGQPYPNHNGGHILFGPDGYLYIGMGDGGAANDPQNKAQDLNTLLGKILRLDVDNADPYGAPPDNPFVGNNQGRPEIWSYGWRNPWRMAFDPLTGDLYIADVGQNQYEEVHVEWAGTPGGQNYGWRLMEGFHCFNPSDCDPDLLDVVLPVTEYDHNQGCSVTGGYVYRGTQFPELTGVYFYGDFCTGKIWGLRHEIDGSWSQLEMLQSQAKISSFGQDETGEIYLVDHKGTLFQVAGQ